MERQLWVHQKSGEVWAVEVEAGRVVAACGPLHYSETSEVYLDAYEYEYEDADWIGAHEDDCALYKEDPVRRADIIERLAIDAYESCQTTWQGYRATNPNATYLDYVRDLIESEVPPYILGRLTDAERHRMEEMLLKRIMPEDA